MQIATVEISKTSGCEDDGSERMNQLACSPGLSPVEMCATSVTVEPLDWSLDDFFVVKKKKKKVI